MNESVAALAVSPSEKDRRALRTLFSQWSWNIECVSTMEEARSLMMRCGPPSVVICEQDLPDGNWHLLFQQTEALSRPPSFIVSSRLADEHLWSEVLNLGGFDVLSTPFAAREVFHVVCCAWDSWHQQWGIAAARRQVAEAGASKALRAGAGS